MNICYIIHTLTQIPQPIHNSSEMKAILDAGVTSIQSFPGSCTKKCVKTHMLEFQHVHYYSKLLYQKKKIVDRNKTSTEKNKTRDSMQ